MELGCRGAREQATCSHGEEYDAKQDDPRDECLAKDSVGGDVAEADGGNGHDEEPL